MQKWKISYTLQLCAVVMSSIDSELPLFCIRNTYIASLDRPGMNEKPIKMKVTCYHCKETFECEFLERSAFLECPICEGSNWVRAPYSDIPRFNVTEHKS